jgi:transposase
LAKQQRAAPTEVITSGWTSSTPSSYQAAFPIEFRNDVVAVARKGEASIAQVARDFGIAESCLHRWLKLADIDDGVRPGVAAAESAELRELKKRNRLLEQENEILRRAAAFFARESLPK